MKRKSLHINLTIPTHTAFKMVAAKNQLSMQELFEEFAIQVVEGDAAVLEIIENLRHRKHNGKNRKFVNTDKESIFDEIRFENPMD